MMRWAESRLWLLVLALACVWGCAEEGAGSGDAGGDSAGTSGSTSGSTSGTSGSTSGTSGTSGSTSGTVGACDDPQTGTGDGTFYDADGSGNCSFPPAADLHVAAMNEADYGTSAICGACVEVTGPKGTTTVRVTDRCPECAPGDIDLAAAIFSEIADPAAGRVPITWRVVPCDVQGPLRYFFKEGSNPWWLAVQVRDHRHPIASLEMLSPDGSFRALPRERYNFFINDQDPGPGPYTFRVTDIYGHTQTDNDIPFAEAQARDAQAQLPSCP